MQFLVKNLQKSLYAGLFVLGIILTSGLLIQAQDDAGTLTLERIFSSDEFKPERFGPARWLEDGSAYTTLEKSVGETGGREIVKYDPKSGERSILIQSFQLVPEGKNKLKQPALLVIGILWIKNVSPSGDGAAAVQVPCRRC